MTPRRSTAPTSLSMRPLACSVMLALLALPVGGLAARELDGEDQEIVVGPDDGAESWTLRNGARLVVHLGQARSITAESGSQVTLSGARVTRDANYGLTALLRGGATLDAAGTTFLGGGLWLNGASSVHLTNSSILMDNLGADFRGAGIGVSLLPWDYSDHGPMHAVLDSTLVRVRDVEDATDNDSGLGVRLDHGTVELINGSHIEAANVGVLFFGVVGRDGVSRLRVDNSTIRAGRGAAIHVDALANDVSDRIYDIEIANGAQLFGGDGNLLRVEGQPHAGRRWITLSIDDAQLAGDITVDAPGSNIRVDVALRNNARIDGRFLDVSSATLGTGSLWRMTGDSNVGRLQLDADGTVVLGDGSTFNTLSVDDFVGHGGTLRFNTALGDDTSGTDTLVITGDANGQAGVRVLNAGGAGAQTDQGIELISVGGDSNARFDLIGRAVGGQYEYFLVKGSDGGWYLCSEVMAIPEPCQVDPSLPECQPIDPEEPIGPEDPIDPIDPIDPVEPIDPGDPVNPMPVLRPETGAYLANQFALHHLLRHSGHDRAGKRTAASDGVHAWANVDSTHSRLRAAADQLALNVERSRLQIGADIGVFDADRGRLGVILTAAQSEATSRSAITGYSARGKVQGGAVGAYGSWSNDALYLDASVQRGQFRNRVEGDGLDTERYDAELWQSSLEAGYRFDIGQLGGMGMNLQPELQLIHTDAATDQHRESNGTVVRSLGDNGLSSRLGLRLQGQPRSGGATAVSPYLAANWYRDGALQGMAFDDEVIEASTPRSRYALDAGVRINWRSQLSTSVAINHTRGDSGYRETSMQLGMAYLW
ncbi:autotransporter outer membrane beta-barrel domain-containing protein [Stenotrophomonas sp. ISL-67]|uniref:autotransporter family protein n=1 Tax=Stenotrophomonas sp. ISL-67 TaxID=2819171 RepID=UPI001BE5C075|nr:autotransporter outer membrane beta-barrel domain-containing protein [Stenotrophomonas sp. ISL-67]MBT2768217.1 autotransporter outer membrane beta-barrel domain-containing protein [Stenotrophomonas sp. ISL-67]